MKRFFFMLAATASTFAFIISSPLNSTPLLAGGLIGMTISVCNLTNI